MFHIDIRGWAEILTNERHSVNKNTRPENAKCVLKIASNLDLEHKVENSQINI